MKIEIKPETLKEIAETLDMGNLCFYHKVTGELECYPERVKDAGLEEFWEDIMNKVDLNRDDYLEFEVMSSHGAYRVMGSFIETIEPANTRAKFIDAIARKKPFRQFEDIIGNYPDLREQWFDYKVASYIDFVKDQLDDFNDLEE